MADQQANLSKGFNDNAPRPDAAAIQRTRIDGRTVGYPAEQGSGEVEWMGMSPAPGKGDKWLVLTVREELNKYLSQIDENERLVRIASVLGSGEQEPLTFEKAVEYLAVWEYARMMKGATPVATQTAEDLARHYYKDIAMRRGYLVSTTGSLAPVQDVYPASAGNFLKSDIEAMQKYRAVLRGDDALGDLLKGHSPLYISETTVEDDLESFGQIAIFEKMDFFAEVLVEYARVQIGYIEKFYADPSAGKKESLESLINGHKFFGPRMLEKFKAARDEVATGVFRFFHVDQASWDKELDLKNKALRIELLKNPDARQTLELLEKDVTLPLDAAGLETVLVTSARALIYFRETMRDSPQKDALERKGVYSHADINDLLNFLDLLEIKQMYIPLAEAALTLPGTARAKELDEKKAEFLARVASFKKKLKENGNLSPQQEKDIDSFVKASSHVYLLDRMEALPGKIAAARRYMMDQVLPKPQQLTLDLDFSASSRTTAGKAQPSRSPGIVKK